MALDPEDDPYYYVILDKMHIICYTANVNEDLEVEHGSRSRICRCGPPFHCHFFAGIIQEPKSGGHCSPDAEAGNEKEHH